MTATREPRRVRRARRRTAHYAHRVRTASTAAERFRVAADELLSVAARDPRAAEGLTAELAEQAADVVARAELVSASRGLYEAQLARGGTVTTRLGAALMCLRAAITRLPVDDAEIDRLHEHYTTELAREAAALRKDR